MAMSENIVNMLYCEKKLRIECHSVHRVKILAYPRLHWKMCLEFLLSVRLTLGGN